MNTFPNHPMLRRIAPLLAATSLVARVTFAQSSPPPAPPAAPAPPAPATAPAAAPSTPAAAELPTAESLLADELRARGGKEAVEAVKQMTSKGAIEFKALGLKGPMTTQVAEPGQLLTTVEIAKGTSIRTGFNGTIGWSIDPALGPRLLEGKELEQLRTEASFSGQSSIAARYAEAKVVGEATWHDQPAYELLLKSPDREATVYLSKSSKLVIGMKATIDSARGSVPVAVNVAEYKEFVGPKGAIKMPVRSEMLMMGMTNVITIETVDFSPIPATAFDLPPQIKALVDTPAPVAAPAAAPAAPSTSPPAPAAPSGTPASPPTGDNPANKPK